MIDSDIHCATKDHDVNHSATKDHDVNYTLSEAQDVGISKHLGYCVLIGTIFWIILIWILTNGVNYFTS